MILSTDLYDHFTISKASELSRRQAWTLALDATGVGVGGVTFCSLRLLTYAALPVEHSRPTTRNEGAEETELRG